MAEQSIHPLHPVPRPPDALKKKKPPPDRPVAARKPAPDRPTNDEGERHIDTYA